MSDPNDPWTRPLRPRPEPFDPTVPPSPLGMDNRDYERVRDWLSTTDNPVHESHHGERLLVEILDALRSIDDKLAKMLDRQSKP